MESSAPLGQVIRFGVFEVDLGAGELRKQGLKVRIQDQPFQILSILLERPGEVVTREELCQRLWPDGTFVEFDHSVSTAISKLRDALGDTAENPRFVETLARRGYRFIAPADLKRAGDSRQVTKVREPAPWRSGYRRLVWVAGILLLLGSVAVAVWFIRSSRTEPESLLSAVPLTTYPGVEGSPSFSPDGNQVAFSWDGEKQDNRDIYVKLVGSGMPLRLTTNPATEDRPAWSPDGRLIAFLRELPGEKAAVLLVPALGGPEHKVAETTARRLSNVPSLFNGPAWSPDSKWLVIADKSSATEPYALFLLSIESSEKRRLTTPPAQSAGDLFPAFSQDGRTLAFIRTIGSAGFASDIYLLDLSGDLAPIGPPKQLTFGNRMVGGLAWTPDGQEIVFSSGTLIAFDLWRIAVSGSGKPRPLASLGNNTIDPAISRQGHRLAYSQESWDMNICRAEVAAPGSSRNPPTKFIASTRVDAGPQFSPDGKKIVFVSGRSSRSGFEIWACDSDGSNATQLTSLNVQSGTPHWSPDGERIAFDSNVEGQWEIYVMSANGSKPQRLTTNPAKDDSPSWSRDGKWIYFCSDRTGEDQVWKMAASGGEAIQLTRKGGYLALESADGKFLYYSKSFSGTSLWKIPVEGGEETQVLESLGDYDNFVLADHGIYFIPKSDAASGFSIQFFSLVTGKIRPILKADKPTTYGLSVSPDGRWILYSQLDQAGSDLMLVENFR